MPCRVVALPLYHMRSQAASTEPTTGAGSPQAAAAAAQGLALEMSQQLVGRQLWQKLVVQALPTTLQNWEKVDKQLQKVIKVSKLHLQM